MSQDARVTMLRLTMGFLGMNLIVIARETCIAAPLTNLTRGKVEFRWNNQCQEAFEELKTRLMQAPILVKADTQQPFVITTDASYTHVGGVLSLVQSDASNRAIGYFSRKLKGAEFRYSATDKEALAVVLTCRNFGHYLWGSKSIPTISL